MKTLWLIAIILSIIIEIITAGLTLVWVSIGAAAALLSCFMGANHDLQIIIFLGITAFLLYFARPYSVTFINRNQKRSHLKNAIGQQVRVIDDVPDNVNPGRVFYNDMEWLAVSSSPDKSYYAGDTAVIYDISGINLIIGSESGS